MTFRDAVSLAFRNLRQAKLRTFLTVLGVSIGIASLAGMVSLGVGLQDQFVDRFIRSGMFDSINVLPGQVQLGGLMGGEQPRWPAEPAGCSGNSAADAGRRGAGGAGKARTRT